MGLSNKLFSLEYLTFVLSHLAKTTSFGWSECFSAKTWLSLHCLGETARDVLPMTTESFLSSYQLTEREFYHLRL